MSCSPEQEEEELQQRFPESICITVVADSAPHVPFSDALPEVFNVMIARKFTSEQNYVIDAQVS